MNDKKSAKIIKYVVFPVVLFLFPLLKVSKGIDLTDTTYSLGNFVFFPETDGVWFRLTFLSNVAGYVLTLLPFAQTMLGMKIYTSLLISLTALLGYRFFVTKMPAYVAFVGEMTAIGLCWIPSGIMYNYLTFFFLLLGCIFLFRGLAGTDRKSCLFIAGVFLGINTFVRFPNNALETSLILALWIYAVWRKKEFREVAVETLLCLAGYVSSFAIIVTAMSFIYGRGTLPAMITGVLDISKSASDYTLKDMLFSITDAYLHGLKWAAYMVICVLPGIPFFVLWKDKFVKAKKIVYCLCVGFLFFVLMKWGMFNFKYYQKESALQWGVIFLLIALAADIYVMYTKHFNYDWKLISLISFIVILITPLGSNNYVWPVLNNLFFIAPVALWVIYRFVRWGRQYLDNTRKVPLFAPKAMLAGITLMFILQSVAVGCVYSFLDGENGEKVTFSVADNKVLKGMKTNAANAEALSGLSEFFNENESLYDGKKLILYGNIPGLSYVLSKPTALNTTWSDLDSNPVEEMQQALMRVDGSNAASRPLVIISRDLYDCPDNSIKFDLINSFISDNNYSEKYVNNKFVVFE